MAARHSVIWSLPVHDTTQHNSVVSRGARRGAFFFAALVLAAPHAQTHNRGTQHGVHSGAKDTLVCGGVDTHTQREMMVRCSRLLSCLVVLLALSLAAPSLLCHVVSHAMYMCGRYMMASPHHDCSFVFGPLGSVVVFALFSYLVPIAHAV